MIDIRNLLKKPIKNYLKTYDNIRRVQGDGYTTGCLLDSPYYKKYHKLIAIDLSKQQKLESDPKAIHQINFTGYLNRAEGATFIIEEAKETVLDFSKGAVKLLWFYFVLI